jgi:non-specific serine/threonine protein kinase
LVLGKLDHRIPCLARRCVVKELAVWGGITEAVNVARDSIERMKGVAERLKGPRELAEALLQESRESFLIRPAFRPREETAFVLQGDYWTIRYQAQIARLKTTRGLHCLGCLLRHPGREFHVSELIVDLIQVPVLAEIRSAGHEESGIEAPTTHPQGSAPILDAQAKAEYKRRLHDLREDLEEAEQFSDRERAARVQEEMNSISEQLAAAVGLGGRQRPAGSHSERARSAVTKRIKESINRIGEVIPGLGRHLAARIKTGYFCSYNPHPDRPVAWKF